MKTFNKLAVAVVTATSLVTLTTGTVFADFYPARQTYTCTTPTNCKGANHVTFNSFTNNSVAGDERAFLSGDIQGSGNTAAQDRLKVKDGDIINVRAYVHNNADATLMGGEQNTVAHNVKFKLLVPTGNTTDKVMTAYIGAKEANPQIVNDTMSVYGNSAFTLSYVSGSATFTHKPDGVKEVTDKLGDAVATDAGVSLGDIKGCFAYSGWVEMEVKVSMPTTPTTPTTPKELPNTGAGDVIGVFAGVVVASAIGYRLYLSRKFAR